MSKHRLLLLLGLLLLLSSVFAATPEVFPGLRRKWQYFQSPNFELYSANSERESRDVLEKMELLHAVFVQEFGLQIRIPRRVTIYYFSEESEFLAYTPPRTKETDRFVGYSFAYADQMIITMAPMSGRRWARELAYRQCVRFLFQVTDRNPPDWFQIGMGELMATIKEDGDKLVIGGADAGHLEFLKKNGFDPIWQMMARDGGEVRRMIVGQRRLYDAQCWAVLHYCMYAKDGASVDQRDELLRTAGSELSRNRPRWFERQIGSLLAPETSDLAVELQRYISTRRLATRQISRPSVPDKARYDQRAVGIEEMSAQLAELGFRARQAAYGTYKVQEMFSKDPSLRLHELIGAVAGEEGDLSKLREHWSAAVDLGTTNVGVLNELCRVEADNVFTQFDLGFRLPEKRAVRLRELLHKSIAVAPEQSTAYMMLLWVEANAAVPMQENIRLVSDRLEKLSDPASARLALALVCYRQRDMAGALALLDQVGGRVCTTWIAAWAEILRATIEKRPPDQEVVNRRPNRT